eukprot:TRINITY_DN28335_c0_g1_i7.p1 TRINITY_DN28335_c0_g1~~TRINITY_DN28335_c0_g1_i7.p1  ORF type:complete len:150 (-),score=35.04 TRINITY_DN28335_c0_g1_i7:182-631(-)
MSVEVKPDAVIACYPVLSIQPALSTSRLLSLTDLLLPYSIMISCLDAYTGTDGLSVDQLEAGSPLDASDEQLQRLPTMHLFGAELDPLLDDSIGLVHRLEAIEGTRVHFDLFEDMPHGCLSLAVGCTQYKRSIDQVGSRLAQIITTSSS